MIDSKDDNQGPRIPYEPPRLFDLGGGVAYAAVGDCIPGGSPTSRCKDGSIAGTLCKVGSTANPCGNGGTG